MSDEVTWASYSSIAQHRKCPQQWFYSRVQRFERIPSTDDPKVELEFGLWWHALRAADSIVRGEALGTLRHKPKVIKTVDGAPPLATEGLTPLHVIAAASEHWENRMHDEVKEAWAEKLGGTLVERLIYVNDRYLDEHAEERRTEEPMAVEFGWGRNLPPLADGTDPKVRLVGYVDEVYRDKRRNVVVVRDHKTGKSLDSQTTLGDMMDSQLQLYAWAVAPDVEAWGMGKVRATAYDRVCSVAPGKPHLTKAGKLTKRDGKEMVGSTDLHTYNEWVAAEQHYPGLKKDGSGAGVYVSEDHIVDRLGSPAHRSSWFQRTLTPLNMNVVRSHLRAASDSAIDSALTRQRAAVAGEAPRNLLSTCKWCDFSKLCRAQMMGGPDGDYPLIDYGLRAKT